MITALNKLGRDSIRSAHHHCYKIPDRRALVVPYDWILHELKGECGD
jgi:hypothetical protein